METPVTTDWLQIARDSFSASTTYFDANIRPRIEADMRQVQGIHPKGSKYLSDAYKNRSKLFRPKARASLRKTEAMAAAAFFTSEDVVSVRATDDNDQFQKAAAECRKALLQYRLSRPAPVGVQWYQNLLGAIQEAGTCGVVASFQDWEYNAKKKIDRPRIRLLPVENVRIDPAADWTDPVNSSPYIIVMWPMYVKDIKARMAEGKWIACQESEIQAAVKSNMDSTRLQREGGTDTKSAATSITDYSIAWVHENIVEQDGIDYVYFTLTTTKLLSDPIPLEQKYYHGVRPIVIGNCVLEAHKAYPTSKVGLAKDVLREINEVTNQRMDNVKLVMDKRYLAKRNKQVDLRSLTRNVPGSVTLVQDLDDVKTIDTPDVTSSSYEEQNRLNLDYDDIAGGFSGSTVQSNRAMNETVGGMNMIASSGNQLSEYELRTFVETWVEPVIRQISLLQQHLETDEKVLALAGKAAQVYLQGRSVDMDELIAQEVLMSINVGIGATNPQAQVERFFFGLKSLAGVIPGVAEKLNLEEVVSESFGKLGYKDGKRFFKFEDQQDPMVAIQQMLAQAKVELTKAQTEKAKEDAAQSQAAKVVKMVEALYSAMQAGQVAINAPGAVPVADAIALSAGYQDQDKPPLIPEVIGAAAPAPAVTENTSPMFPAVPEGPGEGMMAGIETERADGVTQ